MRPAAPGVRRVPRVAVATALAVIAAATLVPGPPGTPSPSLCIWCGDRALADSLLNIVLLVPLGAALAAGGWSTARIALMALVLSAGIELAQLTIAGRVASLGDLGANTAGAALGAWLLALTRRVPPLLTRHALVAAAVAGAVPLGTALLLQPELPDSDWYGQWATRFGGMGLFEGRILAVTIGPVALPDGRLAGVAELRRRLTAGERLEVRGLGAAAPQRPAPLFSIGDTDGRTIVMLAVDRDDLVYRRRMRAARFRFDQPDLRARGLATSFGPGDSLHVAAWQRPDGWCLRANAAEQCGVRLPVGRGWSLLRAGGARAAPLAPVLDVAWLAAIFIPLGYVAGGASGVTLVLVALALMGVAPVVAPGTGLGPGDVLGAGLGLLLGRLVRRHSLRAGTRPA